VLSLKRGVNAPFLANPGEIASYAQLPLLGVLPIWARSQHLQLLGATRSTARTEQDEALGLLYVRLRHQAAQNGKELRSVLFASEDAKENSILACNFVNLAAREGERVLLIDTCSLNEKPDASPGRREGLKAVLEGQQAWRNVVVRDPDSQTYFLPSSNESLDGLDAKSATRLRSMLHEAVEDYTLVVIASSCGIRSVQASHLIKASDFTLLIINSQRVRPAAVSAAVDYLTSIKSDLGLAVLSRNFN
jgi:Mrp family chromosome partitioning ATPase